MPYSSYDHDKLEAAETMRIERRIYFEAKDREIAPYASLPIAQLLSMRSESAAAEQAIFDDLKERAAAWEEQAGRTLLLDKTLEYVRTPHVQHTANEWQTTEHNRHIRSNRVYQMNYYIYENTRYDKEAQKSIPYSWTLTWSVRTNSPSRTQAKIAGQDRKVFTDKAAMEKYLNGRIKAYDRLFTEISPPIPQEYADYFKVNGMLMPDYTIEGEEPPQQQQAAAIPENTGQEKEREHMSEQFSIMIGNRSRFDAGDPGGYWLDMPATKEQLHEAMRNVGITADNPQDFSIRGYSDDPEKHIALPYEMVCAADVDELNFLAARLEQLDPAEVGKLNAALQQKNGLANGLYRRELSKQTHTCRLIPPRQVPCRFCALLPVWFLPPQRIVSSAALNVCRDLRQLPASMQTQYRRFPARSRKRTQAASRLSFRDLRYSLSQPLRLI